MNVKIKLLPKQLEFLQAQDRLVLFMAGIGSGKTRIGAIWAILRATSGRLVLVVSPTYGMARDSFLRTITEVMPLMGLRAADYDINLSMMTITFRGSGMIWLRSADAPDRIRGINADDGLMDEAWSLRTREAYDVLIGRLRRSHDSQIRIVGSPTPVGWAREVMERGRVIRQTTLENFFLPKSYIDDLVAQYGVGTAWYRQEVLGEIVEMGTGIIPSERITITDYDPPMAGRTLVRAWDTAASMKTDGDYWASALLSLDELTGAVHIHDITRRRGAYSSIRPWVIQTITSDPTSVWQILEGTAAGQIVTSDLMREASLRPYTISLVTPASDKVSRCLPFASRVSVGVVSMSRLPILRDVLDEMKLFPNGQHDDIVDAVAYAYKGLAESKAKKTQAFTHNFF